MRIALACPYAWDAPGGVQVHVGALAEHLRSRGHQVLVLAPASSRRRPGATLVGRSITVPYQGTVAPICPWPTSFLRVRRALRAFHPDVVHAHEPLTPSTSMFAVLSSPAPVVATLHAYSERSRLFDVAAPLLRLVWRRIAVRVAVSDAAARFVETRLGNGIRVIPNGVDVDLFAGNERAADPRAGRVILWVGRLDPQKGFPVLVKAFAELVRASPDLSLLVVGEGRDHHATSRVPPEVRDRIVMTGTVPHESLSLYHARADVFVSPALGQESFGMVLVEAMAAGVPVVASDIAGYREVVRDGVDGILTPPGDASALAAAIRRVLTEPGLADRLREAGRARAERYRWRTVVDQLEEVYREAART